MKAFRYFDVLMAAFVAVLLISNIASSAKIIDWGFSLSGVRMAFDAGTLLFPLSYIFGDVLTEVYGYAKSRRVIWTGFAASALMSLCFLVIQHLPGEAQWVERVGNVSYENILGPVSSGAIVLASLSAYLVGEFLNSFVLAKLKVRTGGKFLWVRTILSTLVGQGADTAIFITVATLFGVFPWEIFVTLLLSNYLFKVGVEVLFTPMTYAIVGFLKRREQEDFYDRETTFNPLIFS